MPYHLSPTTGRPNQCRATRRACPFGGEEQHYATKEEAREAYEASRTSTPAPLRKKEGELFPSVGGRSEEDLQRHLERRPHLTMETENRGGEEVGVAYANGEEIAVFRRHDQYEALHRVIAAGEWVTVRDIVTNDAARLDDLTELLAMSEWELEKEIDQIEQNYDSRPTTSQMPVRRLNRQNLSLAHAAHATRLSEGD